MMLVTADYYTDPRFAQSPAMAGRARYGIFAREQVCNRAAEISRRADAANRPGPTGSIDVHCSHTIVTCSAAAILVEIVLLIS
jgi:hypothetical protein